MSPTSDRSRTLQTVASSRARSADTHQSKSNRSSSVAHPAGPQPRTILPVLSAMVRPELKETPRQRVAAGPERRSIRSRPNTGLSPSKRGTNPPAGDQPAATRPSPEHSQPTRPEFFIRRRQGDCGVFPFSPPDAWGDRARAMGVARAPEHDYVRHCHYPGSDGKTLQPSASNDPPVKHVPPRHFSKGVSPTGSTPAGRSDRTRGVRGLVWG